MFGHKTIHINLSFTKSNLQILYWYALNISRMLTDCVEDASIDSVCEEAQALA